MNYRPHEKKKLQQLESLDTVLEEKRKVHIFKLLQFFFKIIPAEKAVEVHHPKMTEAYAQLNPACGL